MQDTGIRKKQPHSQAPPQLAVATKNLERCYVTKNLGRHREVHYAIKNPGDNNMLLKSWEWDMGMKPGMRSGNEAWDQGLGMRPGIETWDWDLGLRPGIETWDWDLGMRSKRQPKKTKKFQTLFIVTYVANFQKSFSYKYLTISCDNVLQSLLEGLPQFIFSMINSITATWYCFWHAWVRQEGWHTKFGQKGCKSRGGSNMLTLDQVKTAHMPVAVKKQRWKQEVWFWFSLKTVHSTGFYTN